MTDAAPQQPATTPPGWYVDPTTGRQRLWDGREWGPVRSGSNEMATLAHLGAVLMGIVVPAIVYGTAKPEDRFTRHHGAEALNKDIWFAILWVLALPVWFAVVLSAMSSSMPQAHLTTTTGPDGTVTTVDGTGGMGGFPTGVLVTWLVLAALMGLFTLVSIVGGILASRRKWFRYPMPFRFVKGLTREELAAARAEDEALTAKLAALGVPR